MGSPIRDANAAIPGRLSSNPSKPSVARPVPLGSAANRKVSTLNTALHIDRLRDQIKGLRDKANELPAGEERDILLRQAEQDEIALRLLEWINSPGQLPPPENLVPMRRHRLRPK